MYTYHSDESVLRDLKALLIEAKQKVPPFLHQLDSLSDDLLDLGGILWLSKSCIVTAVDNSWVRVKGVNQKAFCCSNGVK